MPKRSGCSALSLPSGLHAAGPDHEDELAALLVLERIEDALCARGEVRGVGLGVLLERQLGAGRGQRRLEGGHAVAAEGVVLRQGGDHHAGLAQRHRVGDGVLRRVAPGAEDVAVPVGAGDAIGHRRLDQQDLLVLGGHRQHGQRHARVHRADGQRHVVVAVGLGQHRAADVGLGLRVLLDHHDLAAEDFHLAAGGVFEPHHEADVGLLGVGLERAGLVVDVRDPDVLRLSAGAKGSERERCCKKCPQHNEPPSHLGLN